ncbi:MAG TPA: sulfatase [Planctomycetota bacterium]
MRGTAALLCATLVLGGVGAACAQTSDPGRPEDPGVGPPGDKRPNILFVFTDDHAVQAIGAYGSRFQGTTPNIDRLAAEGIRFDAAFVGNSICAPSRATILTGQHSHRNGVIDNVATFDGAQDTFPKHLQAAGYQTAMIGKWHLKSDPTGFDFWEVLLGQGPYYNPQLKSAAGVVRHQGYTTDVLAERAFHWLNEVRDPDKPFLLMWQHKAPHREWAPGPLDMDRWAEDQLAEPGSLFDDYAGRAAGAAEQEMTLARHFRPLDLMLVPPGGLSEPQLADWNASYGPRNAAYARMDLDARAELKWRYQRYVKNYLRAVYAVDRELGRVLDWLEANDLAGNTIVVYASDQGFYLGEHGWYDKRWMYEESMRFPLIVRWPGVVAAGSTNAELVQNLDLGPTFLQAAGLPTPPTMQGRSLVSLLRGSTPDDWRDAVYYHYYEYPDPHKVLPHFGVRTDRYKLIRYYTRDLWELFDLELDPQEMHSVHDDPAYAAVRAGMERRLIEVQREVGDLEPERSAQEFHRAAALERTRERGPEMAVEAADPATATAAPGNPGGRPFTAGVRVRGGGVISTLSASLAVPSGREFHVAVRLDADGEAKLFLDGRQIARGKMALLSQGPLEGFQAGQDAESAVGPYPAPHAFSGTLRELRYWWGALPDATLVEWARR